ncbi:MAG: leucine-rich repeat domain-containing protein [Bacteroidales bacterium]|nr:leucine-rich repeat domain-containing protein [Bacteroidales bacterium]
MNLKNNKAVLLLAAFMLSTLSLHAYNHTAVSPSGDTLCYNVFDGAAALTYRYDDGAAYSNLSDTVIIPSSVEYNGTYYSVTSIEDRAFYGCSMVTKFILPNTLTSIGSNAFRNCSGMTSIDIPSSVTLIGFATFRNCTSLTSISIPYGLSDIDGQMFYDCINLESVTIPSSVTWIYSGAFYNCTKLISLNIPSSVVIIDGDAFYLVKNVVYNGSATGSPWGALTHNGTFEGDFIYSNSAKTHLTAYIGNSTEVTVPSGVQTIRQYAFANSSNIRKVSFPSSLTTIYSYAFSNSGLDTLVIPNSVTSIKSYAFYGCHNLVSVTLGYGLTSINDWVFESCTSLDSIAIPYSVTSIGYGSFYRCTGLTKVELPLTLTSIGTYSFYRCTALQEITIPSLVTSIGGNAFNLCSALTTVNMLPNNPPSVSCNSFSGNNANRIFVLSCGSLNNYINNSSWSCYQNALHDRPDFDVTLTPNIPGSGTIDIILQGGYVMGCDSSVSFMAIPNYGYHFVGWSDGEINSTRTIFLSGDTSLTAIFAPDTFALALNVNDTAMGSVSGAGPHPYLDTVLISAIPAPHHHFLYWSINGTNTILTHATDTVVITDNLTLTAHFAIDTYQVAVLSDNLEQGTVSGEGLFPYGHSCTVSATANHGYAFHQWSDGTQLSPYTFTLDRDTTLTAYFTRATYTLNLLTNNSAMGSVSGAGNYLYLDTASISALPASHHHFLHWSNGSTLPNDTVVITDNLTLTAHFAIDTYQVSVLSDNLEQGTVSGGGLFEYGQSCTVVATPLEGYVFLRWSDGSLDSSYTFIPDQDIQLTAFFAEENHIVNISVASNDTTMGYVTGGGPYAEGAEVSLLAVPYYGYRFLHWNDNNTANPRIFTALSDASFTAFFEAIPTYTVTVLSDDENMGTVSNGGTFIEDTCITIEAFPREGFHFVRWNDNNTDNPRTVTVTGNITYTAYFSPDGTHEGIRSADNDTPKIHATYGHIVIENTRGDLVRVYDISGRLLAECNTSTRVTAPHTGVYLVKIDNLPAQKVVVF